jgi:hypothetical protein
MTNTLGIFAVRITVRLRMKHAEKWYCHPVCTISLILINVKKIAMLLTPGIRVFSLNSRCHVNAQGR